jgi:hypothetical protein
MMRIVQVYETDDGKTFGNRTLARQHEVTVEAPEVSTILMSYRKKFPKMESEAA